MNTKTTLNLDNVWPCHIAKIGATLNVDVTKCFESLIAHGLQQKVNDTHSDIKRKDFPAGKDGDSKFHETVIGLCRKMVDKIEAGTWQHRGHSGVTEESAMAKLGMSAEDLEAFRLFQAAQAAAKNGGEPKEEPQTPPPAPAPANGRARR